MLHLKQGAELPELPGFGQNFWFSRLMHDIKRDMWLYAMLLPGIAYIIIFKYLPMYGITIAFQRYSVIRGFSDSPWVGFANFTRLFGRVAFIRAVQNSIIIGVLKMIFGFPLPIILALMMNELRKVVFKRAIQTAVMLPHFINWIVISGILYAIFSTRNGAVITLLRTFGFKGAMPNILADPSSFRVLIIASHLWKSIGYASIIYMAAISGIDQELYEAAQIDGAGRLRQLWHITLACIRPTIVILLIFRVGDVMNAGFDQLFIMQNPMVISVSEIIETYVYKIGMEGRSFSEATAAGLFQSLIGFVLVLITNHFANRIDPGSGIM